MKLAYKLLSFVGLYLVLFSFFSTTLTPKAYAAATNNASSFDTTACLSTDNELSFMICPIIKAGADIINVLDGVITDSLEIDTDLIFGNNSSSTAFRTAWSTFRYISLGIIVLAGLVVVISQSLGTELLDAYTIKKVLPRLIVAIIAINISWPLLELVIKFFNVMSLDSRNIMFAPFHNLQQSVNGYASLSGFAIFLAAGAYIFNLGILGTLSLIAAGALAVLIGIAVIVIRNMSVQILAVLAPIAIACYILPNTQKVWKLWSTNFLALMLMFPIISLMIAAGRIFAVVSTQPTGNTATDTLQQLIGFVAYFAPYFLLGVAFKMAGGFLATISGMVNDRNRGAFDRLRNFRGQQSKKNWENMRAGNRFKGKNFITRRVNRGLEGVSNLEKAGLNPRRWRENMRTALNDGSHDEASKFMKENAAFMAISGDDGKLAGARYTNRTDIERELARFDVDRFGGAGNARARADAATQILRAQRETGEDTFQKARVRAMAGTGTGYQYKDQAGNVVFDANRMLEDINSAYGNDRNGAGRALAEMRGSLTNSGQIAGQAGFGAWAGALEGRYRNNISGQQAHNDIMDDAINSADPRYATYGKPSSAAAMGAAHFRRIQAITNGIHAGTHTQEDLDAATSAAAGILDALGQSSPGNASAFANELMGVTITGSRTLQSNPVVQKNGDLTVREMIEDRMNNPEYTQRRRDNVLLMDPNNPNNPFYGGGGPGGGGPPLPGGPPTP